MLGKLKLSWLELSGNNFQGHIPTNFSVECSLKFISFNGNALNGKIPRSIVNCGKLELLDLGNNMIEDAFPNFLGSLPELQILVLRSNKLHGFVQSPASNFFFPKLRIFDLSDNNLRGHLPSEYFNSFKAMMYSDPHFEYMQERRYYSVRVIYKGMERELEQIQNTLTVIDFHTITSLVKFLSLLGSLNQSICSIFLTIFLRVISNHHWKI